MTGTGHWDETLARARHAVRQEAVWDGGIWGGGGGGKGGGGTNDLVSFPPGSFNARAVGAL